MRSSIRIKSNKKEVIDEMNEKLQKAMYEVAQQAVTYAAMACPVDTGRLRNSITGAAGEQQTDANGYDGEHAKASDYRMLGNAEKNTAVIGTNVEYAQYIEIDHKSDQAPNGFLGIAVTEHMEEYKKIIKNELDS